ncbi:hypothetical protein [Neptuniibacter sp.]|uniref:hypothetical protein n=1 Tax=Neptuniibacter sp. TaxID=1962643 RepID=UPI002622AC74|nr:hypothetical protein [Neptuniibacter sp.]MCP4597013.1 hypothetical protein [Neptuniibacter sp.]
MGAEVKEAKPIPKYAKTQRAFAEAIGKSPQTIMKWKKQGYLVKCRHGYNIDASLKKRAESGLGKNGVTREHVAEKALTLNYYQGVVDEYKSKKADLLAYTQARAMTAQQRILDHHVYGEEVQKDGEVVSKIALMDNNQAKAWFQAISVDYGIKFDKERLERGESTENVAVIVTAIRDLKKKKAGKLKGMAH